MPGAPASSPELVAAGLFPDAWTTAPGGRLEPRDGWIVRTVLDAGFRAVVTRRVAGSASAPRTLPRLVSSRDGPLSPSGPVPGAGGVTFVGPFPGAGEGASRSPLGAGGCKPFPS